MLIKVALTAFVLAVASLLVGCDPAGTGSTPGQTSVCQTVQCAPPTGGN